MKRLGLLAVGMVIALGGSGYFFFHVSKAPIIVTNVAPQAMMPAPSQEEIEQGQLIDDNQQSIDNNQQTKASNEQLTNDLPTGQAGNKQPTESNQQGIGELKIENRLMSSGFAVPKSQRKIDTIVLHSSYDLLGKDQYSVSGIIKEYEDYGVSAHYLIDRKGTIYRLVEDKNIAYHAGVSKMPDGRTGVNNFSIGIEIMNTEKGQFTNAQYTAVNELITSLKKQYPIKSVVGHQDIAPGRKTDPWNFDWKRLQ